MLAVFLETQIYQLNAGKRVDHHDSVSTETNLLVRSISGTACPEGHRGVCMVSGSPPGITASHGGGGPGPPAKPELSPDGKSIWSPIKTSPTWSSDLK